MELWKAMCPMCCMCFAGEIMGGVRGPYVSNVFYVLCRLCFVGELMRGVMEGDVSNVLYVVRM